MSLRDNCGKKKRKSQLGNWDIGIDRLSFCVYMKGNDIFILSMIIVYACLSSLDLYKA